jgi:hypothetical protein
MTGRDAPARALWSILTGMDLIKGSQEVGGLLPEFRLKGTDLLSELGLADQQHLNQS